MGQSWSAPPLGSSPLTRGAHEQWNARIDALGLIPAYAGSTSSLNVFASSSGAHPRLRGEHRWCPAGWRGSGGSSPLTRGAPDHWPPNAAHSRLIPAYAGSTLAEQE